MIRSQVSINSRPVKFEVYLNHTSFPPEPQVKPGDEVVAFCGNNDIDLISIVTIDVARYC